MIKNWIKDLILTQSPYWFHYKKHLPVGADLFTDLKVKLNFTPQVIFDVGANIGQTAISFSNQFPNATIYSFEPVQNTYDQLVGNCKNYPRVKPVKTALGFELGSMEINLVPEHRSVLNSLKAGINEESNYKETINIDTIDHFANENSIKKIDLLKIDTEGFEFEVLRGSDNCLRGNVIDVIYIEVGFSLRNNRNTYLPEVFKIFKEYDYTFYGLFEISHLQLRKGKHYGNALFLSNNYLNDIN